MKKLTKIIGTMTLAIAITLTSCADPNKNQNTYNEKSINFEDINLPLGGRGNPSDHLCGRTFESSDKKKIIEFSYDGTVILKKKTYMGSFGGDPLYIPEKFIYKLDDNTIVTKKVETATFENGDWILISKEDYINKELKRAKENEDNKEWKSCMDKANNDVNKAEQLFRKKESEDFDYYGLKQYLYNYDISEGLITIQPKPFEITEFPYDIRILYSSSFDTPDNFNNTYLVVKDGDFSNNNFPVKRASDNKMLNGKWSKKGEGITQEITINVDDRDFIFKVRKPITYSEKIE